MIVFGPVPLRRLGRSLVINTIPPNYCPYSCMYCQLGKTNHMLAARRTFYEPPAIKRLTEHKLCCLRKKGQSVDYLSFVPDGEPTLDINLGRHIRELKKTGVKIAVITNASMLWMEDVRKDLMKADLVSVKVDTVNSSIWKKINRPYGLLKLNSILQGIAKFASEFNGRLVTETMLISGVNDHTLCVQEVADFLADIDPFKAYLLVPARSPAEDTVGRLHPDLLKNAYDIFLKRGVAVECLTGDNENKFYFSNDIVNELLSPAAHPVREDIVEKFLMDRNADKLLAD